MLFGGLVILMAIMTFFVNPLTKNVTPILVLFVKEMLAVTLC